VPGDPAYRLLECTRFEVWTASQKQWLVSIGIAEERVNVAGIIVWGRDDALSHPRNGPTAHATRVLRIGLFDVVPPNPTYFLQFGLGDNYYSFERMARLLTDVVEVAESVPGATFEIVVKPKRARVAIHDARYFELQEQLVAAGRLKVGLLPMNPIEAVAACDLVISAPFSSPSVIAARMQIPGCFYDPTGLLREHPGLVPEAPLVDGRDHLRQWLLQHQFAPA
jgi:polysaccharide biosynthesis PFTS motif protein